MSFKINLDQTLGQSIRGVICEQIDAAIDASQTERNGKGSPVHQTRKHLKKARAALRLLAQEAPKSSFRRTERCLRNVGRLISEIRDAEVRLETVKQMRHRSSIVRRSAFRETEELLAFELDSFLAAFAGWPEEASTKLKRARAEIAQWSLQALGGKQVCCGLRRSYKNGHQALEAIRDKGSAPRFHELRKQAKTLWYQLRLLRSLDPSFQHLCHELKKIGESLGHAHDLCFVADRLRGMANATTNKRARRVLEALIDSREEDLQRIAFRRAERFYQAKPRDFSARIARRFEDVPASRGSDDYPAAGDLPSRRRGRTIAGG